eukprot:CAMPEP_0171110010 /NCGR_PEP_ID=MMETSP0766_2-20121228/71109_1 /TAXON_ID=439317 /ORGANISM="Gambierdiscus australes, Strain CAWD 149" /LENGTH=103 /DNA_ID=CAMNT_0011571827 /DNA_START=424 /DNA_END=732 /DNA_ORIENTATION=-
MAIATSVEPERLLDLEALRPAAVCCQHLVLVQFGRRSLAGRAQRPHFRALIPAIEVAKAAEEVGERVQTTFGVSFLAPFLAALPTVTPTCALQATKSSHKRLR